MVVLFKDVRVFVDLLDEMLTRLVDRVHFRHRGAHRVLHQAVAVLVLVATGVLSGTAQTGTVEVIFSIPGRGEAGVKLTTPVRLQFSAHLDEATLSDHIWVAYSPEDSRDRGEPEPPAIGFVAEYDGGDRALTIRPTKPWERFREVRVRLDGGIRSADGRPLKPYELTFMTGGS